MFISFGNKCLRHLNSKVLTTTHLYYHTYKLHVFENEFLHCGGYTNEYMVGYIDVHIVASTHYVDGFCWHMCPHSGHWPVFPRLLVPVCLHLFPLLGPFQRLALVLAVQFLDL